MQIKKILEKPDLSLEVVILLVSGTAVLVSGLLLFPISLGAIPYYKNGLYGLFLILFALQMIMLGKSPIGDFLRSKTMLGIGLFIAAVGITSSFVPNILNDIQRVLLTFCFGAGGLVLFLQMIVSSNKYRAWKQYGGIFWQLILACTIVYALSILIGAMIWQEELIQAPANSIVIMLFGASIVYLAGVLKKIHHIYPASAKPAQGNAALSTEQAMMLLMGLFMVLLGLLLIPVNLDILPFSGSAQLGLLMMLFSIQMLASGNTPIGPFQRSWLVIALGVMFAVLGIISCMIPNLMVPFLTVLVGALNMAGGFLGLGKSVLTYKNQPPQNIPPLAHQPEAIILKKVFLAQLAMNLLSILFGATMFFSNLMPGLLLGFILATNGLVLLYLLSLLMKLDKTNPQTLGIS
ncbi:hypothetical protein ACM5Q9_00290 [Advenella sp. RU8]|uniref:hypothetical protein n=1 Tax=Advenella sp. RU8 TaxID=3399575 RepID=UPI003AAEBAAD